MDYEDGASGYNTSEVDWGEEENHSWSGGGEDHDHEPWGDQTDSEISFGDEPDGEDFEPKPPDYGQGNTSHESWSGEEESDQEGETKEVYEEDTWPEETDSQFCLEDGGHESGPEYGEFNNGEEPWSQDVGSEASYDGVSKLDQEEPELEYTYGEPTNHQGYEEDDETDSQISLREAETEAEAKPLEESWENDHNSEMDQEESWREEEELDSCQEKPQHIYFSGHGHGPEAYLKWERDMEEWFRINQVPGAEKTSYAEDTLTEDAFRCWEQDAYVRLEYDVPDSSWEEMKQMLHKEFVEDAVANQQYYSKIYAYPEPRRWIIATRPNLKAKPKKALCPETKNVSPNTLMEKTEAKTPVRAKEVQLVPDHQTVKKRQSSKQLPKPQERPKQCKSSKLPKEVGTTCYRCHQRGHYAVVCPTRPVDNSHTIELKQDSSSDCLVQSNPEISISSIMHLSLPKSFDPGIRPEEGNTSTETIIFQLTNANSVSLSITPSIPKVLSSDIMHLFLVQNVEIFAGIKEVNCKEVPPDKNRGVILSFLLKGDPPDVSSNIKHQLHQGKVINSQFRMKTNLHSLGAEYTVSRSKPFQEGEYDEDIKSSSAKKHRTRIPEEESMNLRRANETRELCLVQREATIQQPCSTNNWRVYSTHPEFTTKKNQPKRILYDKDTEDTIWQIFNEASGDIRSLIESFRPNQDEPSNKSNCFGFSTHQRQTAN